MLLDDTKKEVFGMLTNYMSPEFLNRIDDKIMFLPLDKNEIRQVAMLQMQELNSLLDEKEKKLIVSDEALDLIAENGFDPVYGARPLKRFIQQEITNELARLILGDELIPGNTIDIGVLDGKFTFDISSTEEVHKDSNAG
jgi:ATP-dependent Clp protease ATP-binding subunit ClpB